MGGGASGKGGVADASLNVVPFIDLLACTICFLLVSAVWTQLAKIDVDQALPKASKNKPLTPPVPEPKINIAITPSGYFVNLWNADKMPNPKPELVAPKRIALLPDQLSICRGKGSLSECAGVVEKYKKYDRAKLRETLAGFMKDAALGDKVKIMVVAADPVEYTHLIGTLDAILTVCDEKDKKTCLRNPAVGDINLLSAEGFVINDLKN